MKPIAAALCVAVLAVLPATASAQPTSASLDQRSRTLVYLMRKCARGVSLATEVAGGGTAVQASEAVNTIKSACNAYRDKTLSISNKGFNGGQTDAFGALDYWARGLGRVSNYIDDNLPSDFVKAKEYFETARAFQHRSIVQMNRARAAASLPTIPFANGI